MSVATPQVGHLVRLRGGMWVVSDVRPSAVTPTAATNGSHLVEAVSIDDDSHGEMVAVIWEVEPGTAVIDKVDLPDPTTASFDHPAPSTRSCTPSHGARSRPRTRAPSRRRFGRASR